MTSHQVLSATGQTGLQMSKANKSMMFAKLRWLSAFTSLDAASISQRRLKQSCLIVFFFFFLIHQNTI